MWLRFPAKLHDLYSILYSAAKARTREPTQRVINETHTVSHNRLRASRDFLEHVQPGGSAYIVSHGLAAGVRLSKVCYYGW